MVSRVAPLLVAAGPRPAKFAMARALVRGCSSVAGRMAGRAREVGIRAGGSTGVEAGVQVPWAALSAKRPLDCYRAASEAIERSEPNEWGWCRRC
jgi:hypothetical protein